MKRSGPDSLTSWLIAGACCFINMMMFGMIRLSGVLFVASTSRFQVSRQKASLPYTFGAFMRNVSGPLVGYLGHKFGVRAVTVFGCILAAIGAGTCFFAENITTVTILWGVIFGLGFGMGNILLPVSINQYFDKNRSTASGLSFSGACFGSFILPPIVEVLLNTYGLSGTFLFLAGFILNCVPAALLLKKPSFEIYKSQCNDIHNSEKQSIVSGTKVKRYSAEDNSLKPLSISKKDKNSHITSKSDDESISRQDLKDRKIKSSLTYEERIKRPSTQTIVSECSSHMGTSEPLEAEEKIENIKVRRQDPTLLKAGVLTLTSNNTDQDVNSDKDEVLQKESRSSSLPHEKKVSSEISNTNGKFPSEIPVSEKIKYISNKLKKGYANYGYQVEIDDLKLDLSKNFILKNIQRYPDTESSGSGASRSFSVPHEKPIFPETLNGDYALSSQCLDPEKVKSVAKSLKDGYQREVEALKLDISPYDIPQNTIHKRQDMQSTGNEIYVNYNYQNNEKVQDKHHKMSRNNPHIFSKSSDWSDVEGFKVRKGVLSSSPEKEKDNNQKRSFLGFFNIIFDPTFITIAVTNGLYNFTFVCMITIIVDYARDLNIGTSNEKYILMAFSVGDLIGHLALGWITDCGYMTATSFAALCFACQGITTSSMVLADGFITLTILATLYGLSEAGVIVIYPIIVAQYFGEEKQTVAIPTSNFLSGPVCLAVAPVIGYFRDNDGSYDSIFYIIGIISAICCLGLLLIPCIAKCRRHS